jgi:hypothetical protein
VHRVALVLLLLPLLLGAKPLDEIVREAEDLARDLEACGQDAACIGRATKRGQALRKQAEASSELTPAVTPCFGFEGGSVPSEVAGGTLECLPLRVRIRDESWWTSAGCTRDDERFDIAYSFEVDGQLIRDTGRRAFALSTLAAVPASNTWSLELSSVVLRVKDFGPDCDARGLARFGKADMDFGTVPSVMLAYDHGMTRGPSGEPPPADTAFFSPLTAWGSAAASEATWGIAILRQFGPVSLESATLREAGLKLGPEDVERLFQGESLRREVAWSGPSPGDDAGSPVVGGTRLTLDISAAKPRCSLAIASPPNGQRLVFSTAAKGTLDFTLQAKVAPSRFSSHVAWTVPSLDSKTSLVASPSNQRGPKLAIKLEGLPQDVAGLGPKVFRARIDHKDCQAQANTTVKLFFPRDAKNHPGGGTPRPPNWFHYWKQTKAARPKGQQVNLEYGARTFDDCRTSSNAALYNHKFGYKTIYVCDLGTFSPPFNLVLPVIDRSTAAKVTGTRRTRDIETFAVAVRHEFEHFLVDHNPWSGVPVANRPAKDHDADGLPDAQESGLGFDPKKFQTFLGTHPKWKGIGGDEEWMAHETLKDVAPGSMDKLDWGHPGAQWP